MSQASLSFPTSYQTEVGLEVVLSQQRQQGPGKRKYPRKDKVVNSSHKLFEKTKKQKKPLPRGREYRDPEGENLCQQIVNQRELIFK